MSRADAAMRDGRAARGALLAVVLVASLLVLVAPVAIVFIEAFGAGLSGFAATLAHPDTRAAIGLSIVTALLVVPVNTLFGIAAAWAIARFRFPGRRLLLATIEVPFSVSPIVAGIAYLFVYGGQGLLGPFLEAHELRIMFALPGIVLASMFVTAPYVVHQLIPLMEAQGSDEEEVAATLGARGFAIFRRVTLPNIRWALLYGVVLCNARVLGEFGAVSIVSGNIRGQTNTLPLHIELLYHDYNTAGAFAAASVLALVGLLTLVAKWLLERSGARQG